MVQCQADDIVIVDAARSILGATNGSTQELSAADLASPIIQALLTRLEAKSSKFKRDQHIGQFVLGHSIGAGNGQNVPRQITMRVGLEQIPNAFSVNEMCGSGMSSIITGIHTLKVHEADVVLVGGVEATSQAPYLLSTKQLIEWSKLSVEEIQTKVLRADTRDGLWDAMSDVHTIVLAEQTTAKWVNDHQISADLFKEEIDKYAVLSHDRARQAIAEGRFKKEIVVIDGTSENDELPAKKNLNIMLKRKGTQYTPEGQFLSNHNSPPLANGASFLVLSTFAKAKALDLPVMAKVTGYQKAGTRPESFLLAPLQAVRDLLKQTGTSVSDYDLIESNSAFGSQMIINQKELGLNMEKVNISGDCIALGHPIGAQGARIVTTLLYALKEGNKGLATICLGGGNGIALSLQC